VQVAHANTLQLGTCLPSPANSRTAGRLIAFEGIDGSGKRTQMELLHAELAARIGQHSVYSTGFPQYESWFGKMVGKFLNGELGPLESVDPHFTALLYAGDRFEAKPQLEAALNASKIVLVDRYIGSNLAHQTARAPHEKREEFLDWIRHLEYDIYGLPREDAIVYLRVPPAEAQRLVGQKTQRTYTNAKQDLQEASLRHLQHASEMYDALSRNAPWVRIESFDPARGAMRAPEEIARDVLAAVKPILTAEIASNPMAGGR
jgi:dTMP kinase